MRYSLLLPTPYNGTKREIKYRMDKKKKKYADYQIDLELDHLSGSLLNLTTTVCCICLPTILSAQGGSRVKLCNINSIISMVYVCMVMKSLHNLVISTGYIIEGLHILQTSLPLLDIPLNGSGDLLWSKSRWLDRRPSRFQSLTEPVSEQLLIPYHSFSGSSPA